MALRLAILDAYEPHFDLGLRLNWARRIAEAERLGPVRELAQGLASGQIGAVRARFAAAQDSLLFGLASNVYVYPSELFRIGSALAMAGWMWVFGTALESARLFAILVDLAGLAILAAVAARLTGSSRAGLVAAAVLALLPAKILFSVQPFYHVFGATATLAALWSFVASPAFDPVATSRRPSRAGVVRTGLAFGASMYFDWFLPQLAWIAALACAAWVGLRRGDLGPTLRRFAGMTAVGACLTWPLFALVGFHLFVLSSDPGSGFARVVNQLGSPGEVPLGEAFLGYARNLTEFYTAPLLVIAAVGAAAAWLRDATRGAACLVATWIALHALVFAALTTAGSDLIRAFQSLETPIAIAAAVGALELARRAAARFAPPGAREPAWLLPAVAALATSASLARVPALAAGGAGLERSLPHFHAAYPRGHEIRDVCRELDRTLSEDSNLLVHSWQLIEAVCPEANRWSVANFEGICRRPDAASQRDYLRTTFPSYRLDAQHFVLLERNLALPDPEPCLATVMKLFGASRAVPVIEAAPGARFLRRVVRLE